MPLYDYKCLKCGDVKEKIAKYDQQNLDVKCSCTQGRLVGHVRIPSKSRYGIRVPLTENDFGKSRE